MVIKLPETEKNYIFLFYIADECEKKNPRLHVNGSRSVCECIRGTVGF